MAKVVAAFQSQQESMMSTILKLVERVEKLESNQVVDQPSIAPKLRPLSLKVLRERVIL